jgi:hypothetical protein
MSNENRPIGEILETVKAKKEELRQFYKASGKQPWW